jgi:hypothetical protein
LYDVLLNFNFICLSMSFLKSLAIAFFVLATNACKNTETTAEAPTEVPANEISLTAEQIKSFGILTSSTETVNEALTLTLTHEAQLFCQRPQAKKNNGDY